MRHSYRELFGIGSFSYFEKGLKNLTDGTIDKSLADSRNNRIIVINIGRKPWIDYNSPEDIAYYFANIRLSKENNFVFK